MTKNLILTMMYLHFSFLVYYIFALFISKYFLTPLVFFSFVYYLLKCVFFNFQKFVISTSVILLLIPNFIIFHSVHAVLQARILEWVTISFSSGLCFVSTLYCDLSILGGLAWHGS